MKRLLLVIAVLTSVWFLIGCDCEIEDNRIPSCEEDSVVLLDSTKKDTLFLAGLDSIDSAIVAYRVGYFLELDSFVFVAAVVESNDMKATYQRTDSFSMRCLYLVEFKKLGKDSNIGVWYSNKEISLFVDFEFEDIEILEEYVLLFERNKYELEVLLAVPALVSSNLSNAQDTQVVVK